MKNNFIYRLYGRSKGRKKNTIISQEALEITVQNIEPKKYNIIDIGMGYGESSLHIAKSNKDGIIICCDKYKDGINNLAKTTKQLSLKNIFIYYGNVIQFLDSSCYKSSISEIWILFPDPWPKKKHFKRRLISSNFFYKIKYFLKPNATIHIASDSSSYISFILASIYKVKKDFLWTNQEREKWIYSYQNLPKTKYYKKALKNGRKPIYIKLIKL